MGNEISTLFGAVACAGTAIASGLCLGQCKALNNAVKETAKFTGRKFMDTNVRHVGELVGVSIAAGATLGQCDRVNNCVRKSAPRCGKTLLTTLNDTADGLPIVGHIKGVVHHAVGDKEGGDQALKAASRSVAVVGGAVGGFLAGGPALAVTGAIGAGAVMDGLITAVDSAAEGKYKPAGQIAAWTDAIQNKSPEKLIGGLVNLVAAPVMDGLTGAAVGKATKKIAQKIRDKRAGIQRVYAVASERTIDAMVDKKELTGHPSLTRGKAAFKGDLGETCVTESATKHSRKFIQQRQKAGGPKMACAKFKVDPAKWAKQKKDAIPQQNSRLINKARLESNPKQIPKNVFTREKLLGSKSKKINMNIKGKANLQTFNESVLKVKKINPNSFKYTNGFTKTMYRFGKPLLKPAGLSGVKASSRSQDAPQPPSQKPKIDAPPPPRPRQRVSSSNDSVVPVSKKRRIDAPQSPSQKRKIDAPPPPRPWRRGSSSNDPVASPSKNGKVHAPQPPQPCRRGSSPNPLPKVVTVNANKELGTRGTRMKQSAAFALNAFPLNGTFRIKSFDGRYLYRPHGFWYQGEPKRLQVLLWNGDVDLSQNNRHWTIQEVPTQNPEHSKHYIKSHDGFHIYRPHAYWSRHGKRLMALMWKEIQKKPGLEREWTFEHVRDNTFHIKSHDGFYLYRPDNYWHLEDKKRIEIFTWKAHDNKPLSSKYEWTLEQT